MLISHMPAWPASEAWISQSHHALQDKRLTHTHTQRKKESTYSPALVKVNGSENVVQITASLLFYSQHILSKSNFSQNADTFQTVNEL